MTLTKKHFKAIAEILNKHNVSRELVQDFITYFRTENSLFNSEKFIQAVQLPK